MNRYIYRYTSLVLTVCILLSACTTDEIPVPVGNGDAPELRGVSASLTRSVEVADLKNYVGRAEFSDRDNAVFVTIKRTDNPIQHFTYSDIVFVCSASTSNGVTSIGWSRDKNRGTTADGGSGNPDRIYWSDATNDHTFIGYCTPQQGGGKAFDWQEGGIEGMKAYYGSLGDPTLTGGANDTIDYRSTYSVSPAHSTGETMSGNETLCMNDILLTHSTHIKADDAIAQIQFYHGLAQVRVIVNISDFAASGKDDTKSVVSDMILQDMLTMYKWRQLNTWTQQLKSEDGDQDALNTLYAGGNIPQYDQRKHLNLWIPKPEGDGNGASRTFTFYGLAVPTQIAPERPLNFSFRVTYPDPMNPEQMKSHTYAATIANIRFDAGKCTTINISLNHKNEKMTVGAEYDDWDFIDTPDRSELKKNSTFMTTTERSSVTIVGDAGATIDDATWLYDSGNGVILDIYGNDGTADHPYTISTADQLVSFAYEVKGGRDFYGQYVKLDADITMQPNTELMHDHEGFYTLDSEGERVAAPSGVGVTWPSIGDVSHKFNGTFSGGFRHINRLYGRPLFTVIGEYGIIDHIYITDALGITGAGCIAESSEGIICGANIEGDIIEENYIEYGGSIVGSNSGVVISCSHVGNITSNSRGLGALVGWNDGFLMTCYNVGDAKNLSGYPAYAGIGIFTPRSFAYCCYFNKDLYTSTDYADLKVEGTIGHVAFPLTTAEMQSNMFVNRNVEAVEENGKIVLKGEITDVRPKDDLLYYHLSLNSGFQRGVAYLSQALHDTPAEQDYVVFHAPGTSDDAPDVERVKLKKVQMQWLVKHYANHVHEFQFIPGTYPQLR